MAKFLLLMNYGSSATCDTPMDQWAPEDIAAHIKFQQDLGAALAGTGELVDAQGLSGPELAKRVVNTGSGAPVVTDGPFAESKDVVAGYWLVDATLERALEIAAQASAAPGPNGVPLGQAIEVRELMSAPEV
ncbi:YciI family protein [Saccharothrix xinjiangensis]|uniref:YciI family protein n=1 Tax=Saccharothrix xinjiangensis TaxID=204798 RepID=A0ABV9YCY7_9PSEU